MKATYLVVLALACLAPAAGCQVVESFAFGMLDSAAREHCTDPDAQAKWDSYADYYPNDQWEPSPAAGYYGSKSK